MGYKVGDKVKIVQNTYNHSFGIGEIVVLSMKCANEEDVWKADSLDGTDFWYVKEADIAPVTFTMADIKPCMVIKYRKGDLRLVVDTKSGTELYAEDGTLEGLTRAYSDAME